MSEANEDVKAGQIWRYGSVTYGMPFQGSAFVHEIVVLEAYEDGTCLGL